MNARCYTEAEIQWAVSNRGHLKLATIARLLGRPLSSLEDALRKRGLCRSVPRRSTWESEFRRLHGLGWNDSQIARALGCTRHAAWFRRRSLGLPRNQEPGRRART